MLSELVSSASTLDIIRVIVLTVSLFYVSALDVKTREVNEVIWQFLIVFGLFAIGIDLYTTALTMEYSIKIIANVFTATLIAFILKSTNLFGMADVKAIISIGIVLPVFPELGKLPLYIPNFIPPLDAVFPLVIFTIVVNTTVFLPLSLFQIVYKNYKNGDISRSNLTWLYATKVHIDDLNSTFGTVIAPWIVDPETKKEEPTMLRESYKLSRDGINTMFIMDFLEWRNSNTEEEISLSDVENPKQIKYFLEADDTEWESKPQASTLEEFKRNFSNDSPIETDIETDVKRFERLLEKEEVWVSPGIPFLVPLTIGFLTTILFGDIIFTLMFI